MSHIDVERLVLSTESDVEQKLVAPLLTGENYLGYDQANVFTKEHLKPAALDKGAGKNGGYYPDYSVWSHGFLCLIVEAKSPDISSEVAYREASLYARHINQNYPHEINPCSFLIATNGSNLLFGRSDAPPQLTIPVSALVVGSPELDALRAACAAPIIQRYAAQCVARIKSRRAVPPVNLVGGQALLNAKRPLNTFAAELSPVLRRYFSSTNETNGKEIAEKAYVSSAEITEYDRVLEALLKDRLAVQRDTIVQQLAPGRRAEPRVATAIAAFNSERPVNGQLQIIQGSVGAGKSLFIRRYKEFLQAPETKDKTRWAFIDFNTSPPALDATESQAWLCDKFVKSFVVENPGTDLSRVDVLRGIFARNILRRKPIYNELAKTSKELAATKRAEDMVAWQDDPLEMARGISEYIVSKKETLISVMDNVDKLQLKDQLSAFQLALWFMDLTKSFVFLQMRDETYERFKSRPPLDTFRSSIVFHISPPRFIDVVKRRLDLGLEYLSAIAPATREYTVESGMRIVLPRSDIGEFLERLYVELFSRERNIARVLEAIAGKDVRRALEMFSSIITSGHLSEAAITSTVKGGGAVPITEQNILKILMRTDYRLASDNSGFTTNIFYFNDAWTKSDNFIIGECLFYLSRNRKVQGQIGLEGYFTCRSIADDLLNFGYPSEDVLAALNYLLQRQLITADHMGMREVGFDDSVRILAAGFMHVRVLPERLEYCVGVIPTTPMADDRMARVLSEAVKIDVQKGLDPREQLLAVEYLYQYLWSVRETQRTTNPFAGKLPSGADFILLRMNDALQHGFKTTPSYTAHATELDH